MRAAAAAEKPTFLFALCLILSPNLYLRKNCCSACMDCVGLLLLYIAVCDKAYST